MLLKKSVAFPRGIKFYKINLQADSQLDFIHLQRCLLNANPVNAV